MTRDVSPCVWPEERDPAAHRCEREMVAAKCLVPRQRSSLFFSPKVNVRRFAVRLSNGAEDGPGHLWGSLKRIHLRADHRNPRSRSVPICGGFVSTDEKQQTHELRSNREGLSLHALSVTVGIKRVALVLPKLFCCYTVMRCGIRS